MRRKWVVVRRSAQTGKIVVRVTMASGDVSVHWATTTTRSQLRAALAECERECEKALAALIEEE